MRTRVENLTAVRSMDGHNFGDKLYSNCSFKDAPARDAHFENAIFVQCDFTNIDIRRSVFKLSCASGSGNKIDEVNAAAFLYWFNHFFALPPVMKNEITHLIRPYLRQLTDLFQEEL